MPVFSRGNYLFLIEKTEIRFLRNQLLKPSRLIILAVGRVPNFQRMQILLAIANTIVYTYAQKKYKLCLVTRFFGSSLESQILTNYWFRRFCFRH